MLHIEFPQRPKRKHSDELVDSPKVRDPHHGGANEWCFHNNQFYIRHGINQWWDRVKRVSLTAQRIKALASLVPEEEE
jgi:hypothetical protein